MPKKNINYGLTTPSELLKAKIETVNKETYKPKYKQSYLGLDWYGYKTYTNIQKK